MIKNELEILSGFDSKEILLKQNVSLEFVIDQINRLDWNIFHLVTFSTSEDKWINVSGNIADDGLACVYEEDNEIFIIDEAPESIEQLIDIISSYYKCDNVFKSKYKFTGDKEEREKQEKWKRTFLENQKKEKAAIRKRVSLVLLILLLLSYISYNWYTDDLQFFGQQTETTDAKIVETKMRHIGRGYYMQTVIYEFEYDNELYRGTFEAGQRMGRQKVGNKVQIKFSTSKPHRNKLLGVFKQRPN